MTGNAVSILCFSLYFSNCLLDRPFKQRLKPKIFLFLLEIRIWMVICTMDFSLPGDTRRQKLTNINLTVRLSNLSWLSAVSPYKCIDKSWWKSCPQWKSIGFFRFGLRACKQTMGSDRCQDSYLWIQKTTIKIWTTPKVVKEKKKSVWEKIFDTFTEHYKAAGIGSSRS